MHWYAWVIGPPETVLGFLVTYPKFWKWVDTYLVAPPPVAKPLIDHHTRSEHRDRYVAKIAQYQDLNKELSHRQVILNDITAALTAGLITVSQAKDLAHKAAIPPWG